MKSSEFLSCFQKARNCSFIVLQDFHWNVSALQRQGLWGKYFMGLCRCPSSSVMFDARTHTHARTHTSHQLKSPSACRRVYELFCSRTCIWFDTVRGLNVTRSIVQIRPAFHNCSLHLDVREYYFICVV